MATSYTRQSSFSDGDTITAALFNNEYNQLLNAFSYASSGTTGHRHDGTSAEGGNIHTIGDQDFLNKIVADSTNNRWGVFVEVSSSAVEQVRFQDGVIVPVTDNDIDLGTSSVEFKNAYFDGTVTTDALTVDAAATIGTTLGVTGALTGSSTIQGTTITATTAFVPDASDGAALGTSALEFSDLFLADGAVINFGDDQDVSLTHVVDTGLLLSSTDQLQFGDSGTYIYQSADGVLDLVSDTEIELTATTIDINGAVAMDGAITGGTNITISGELDAATLDISGNADIDGTTNLDAVDIDGAVQIDATVTVGVDDTGYDVKFFGDTASAYMLWDTSADDLILGGAARVVVPESGLVIGSTAVTSTAAELNILDGVSSTAAELNILDGVTSTAAELNYNDTGTSVGTVVASKTVTVDSNKDVSSFRNITLTGELDAGSLDVSGDADIDGTLEADAITVNGTTLATYIRDTVGTNMLSSNTESGITVTYDTTNDNIDFAVDAAQTGITSIYATDLILGEDSQTAIDFGTANEIDFKVDNAARLTLTSGALYPVTDNQIDLGTSSLEFKDAFFDGTVTADAFAGPLTGDITGNADTATALATARTIGGTSFDGSSNIAVALATLATTVTITDNESTDEDNAIIFTAGGDVDGGSLGLESDGTLTYNPSTGKVTATGFVGTLTGNVTGNTSGTAATVTTAAQSNITSLGTLTTLTVDNVIINGTNIGHTSDTDSIAIASDGVVTFSQVPVFPNDTVETADIQDNAVTLAKMASGTDGNIISYDASGNPVAIATGSDGQVLTSTGAGSPPAFEDASASDIAADNISVGDAAVTLTTSSGNITIDAAANNSDIIFKGTDATSDITMLTLDGSDAGTATFNSGIVAGGVIKTDDTTAATSTTDGSLQTDGGLSVVLDAVIGDDLIMLSDSSAIHFGTNSEITLTHNHDSGLVLTHTATGDNLHTVFQLKSEEDAIIANEEIGSIEFVAGDSSGTDAATVAAGIHAIAEDTFTSSANPTKLVFTTGVSETATSTATAKATLSSIGDFQVAGDLVVKDAGLIGSASDLDAISIASDGVVTMNQIPVFSAGVNVSGGTIAGTLATVAQGNITSLGTLTALTVDDVAVDGKVMTMTGSSSDTAVFTAGTNGTLSIVTTDAAAAAANITITADGTFEADGTTITLDSAGDIVLDADDADIFFKDAGTTFGSVTNTSGNLIIKSGTTTALTFSGANVTAAGTYAGGGTMTTGGNIVIPDDGTIGSATDTDAININASGQVEFTGGNVYQSTGNYYRGYSNVGDAYEAAEARGFQTYFNSDTYTYIRCQDGTGGAGVFHMRRNGTTMSEIEENGDFLSATNSYGSTSDERLKEHIIDSGSQWDDIKAMRVRKFSFISDETDGPTQLGVIAQELEASGMNGLVKTKPYVDGSDEPVLDEDGNPTDFKVVKYSILYMKAVKALQEAMERIESLESRIEALES